MKTKSRIILVGKAASGKDYLKNQLIRKGFKREVSYTTRPPRANEVNGIDYHFVSEDKFSRMVGGGSFFTWFWSIIVCGRDPNLFYEYQQFNSWWYGTTKKEWNSKDVFIFTPSGVKDIIPEDRKFCFIVYLDIPLDVRLERIKQRMDSDSAERRIAADEKDFEGFTDYDMVITDPNF